MSVTAAALRRYVVAHQGYAVRFRRASGDDVATEIARLQAVQLDSIAAVDRAHRITLSSRVGGAMKREVSPTEKAASSSTGHTGEPALIEDTRSSSVGC